MKNNWLTLNGDTFLWIKNDKGLLYNTSNFKILRFNNTRKINRICNKLLIISNLYSANISDSILKDTDVKNWINSIVFHKMGVFTPNDNAENQPISLKPILKIQDDIERYKWEQNREINGSIINNLHEITFYLNGSGNGNNCHYKQTTFPTKTNGYLVLSDVVEFCRNSRNPFLTNINLAGALHVYDCHEKLLSLISELGIPQTIHMTIEDFTQNQQIYHDLNKRDNVSIKLLVRNIDKIDKSIFSNIERFVCEFLITSENNYNDVSEIINKCQMENNSQIIPLYDNNLNFFTSTLFLDETDFEDMQLTKRDIFIRQCLNINDFGKLTVLANGQVYANVNHPPIGTIKDQPADLVFKEFTEGKSWLNTRKGRPCNQCIYQWMCPTPSNYEISMKRNNLCNVIE